MKVITVFKLQTIWLISFSLISIISADGQQSSTEVTTISVDNYENNNELNSSDISIPKVQTRLFSWLMNGLSGQSMGQTSAGLNGLSGLGGLLRPNLGSNSPFSRFEASLGSLGSNFGSNGFGMQSMGRPSTGQLSIGRPPMGPPPIGPPPMGPPPPPPPPMIQPQMGQSPMGLPPMGRPPMGQNSGSQSQFGYTPPMNSQGGFGSNYAGNGQPNGQMNGQMGNQLDYMSTNDPYGDYGGGGGGDFFSQIFTFLFGPSGSSSGVGSGGSNGVYNNGGRGNNNGGQMGRPNSGSSSGSNSGSSSGMSPEFWSNYMKMLQTLYSDGGGAGGGGGGGDLSAMIGQATSLIQSFSGGGGS
ncbi:keratin, type I cytoskeletal 9-like [Panonychus citri]|uniref:keratin, type I cytoskeletal 9-like n=1 Tax=Panonychus citri TaxID=50023 RepID=UPI00230822FF|nr:keratin, type I cytoskeletal 9-like [Panonychus citri]